MNKAILLGCSAAAALSICGAGEAATLRGRVFDGAHHAALPGATVTVQGGASVTTNRDGSFTIDDVAAGAQQVTIRYVGFRNATQTLVAGDDPQATDIELAPEVSGGEIVVTGTRLAEARAIQTKRSDLRIVEALYANDVGKLPDQNVAEAVKRLPGVSVANDQGEGRYVIIRGIDPNLVNVTINGQTMPAPEPDGRQVKLDDIPSAMIGSVVIAKSLTPDQDANAIGGEVDIRTLTAFDRNKRFFADARGAAGWYRINGKTPWEADGQIGGLFGADERFGAVLSVNYSRRPIESENFQASEDWSLKNGNLFPDQGGLRDYNLVRTRLGLVGNLDWHPNDAAKIYLRSSYSRFTDNETRDQNRIDSLAFAGDATGTFTGRGSVLIRRREEKDNTKSLTLGGEFDLPLGHLAVSGGWTKAVKLDPIRSEFTFRTGSGKVAGTYDVGTSPFILDPFHAADQTLYKFYKFNLETRQAAETIWQGRADYTLPIGIGEGSTIKVGGKYLDRAKRNNQDKTDYTAGSAAFNLSQVSYQGNADFYDGRYAFGPRIDYASALAYLTANPAVANVDENGTIGDSLSSDYRVKERIVAGYAMATLRFGQLTLIPGVRVERTRDRTAAKVVDENSALADGYNSFGRKSYTNWFPGLTARFDATNRFVLRGAVTTSIGRPNYPDLAPYVTIDNGEDPVVVEQGNPGLKPYKAVNLDVAAEYYLPGQGLLSVGAFYKHIDNPIYAQEQAVANGTFGGQTFANALVTTPINADSEIVKGVEFNAQTRFTFLPSPFDGFGVSVNYTHVWGHAKGLLDRPGTVPLFFQSRDIGTAQLFYEKYGFALRVAYSYRSKYLDTLGTEAATDEYTDRNGQLDIHASYQILPQVTVFTDGTNLTDAPWRRFQGTRAQLVERERYDLSVRGGVQVHF
ncbi:TonB-dependent receptor [Sphingomonas oryzagri]